MTKQLSQSKLLGSLSIIYSHLIDSVAAIDDEEKKYK